MVNNREITLKVILKKGKVFICDEKTGLIDNGKDFDSAIGNLERKIRSQERLIKISGFKPKYLGGLNVNHKISSFTKKFVIAFFFVSLMSIPISYSISNGIKNGFNKIDLPKGSKIWEKIGDEIIKASESESVKNEGRQEKINESLDILKKRIQPYIDFFDSSDE